MNDSDVLRDTADSAYNLIATNDIATQLANVNYRLDMVIMIMLFVVGVASAALVFYLLYRFILRFM